MMFIKVSFGWPKRHIFLPADNKPHKVFQRLTVLANQSRDGRYTIKLSDTYHSDPSNIASELVCVDKTVEVEPGEKVNLEYTTVEWSYLRGKYHSHESLSAVIVDEEVVLAEADDAVVKAEIYYQRGDYQRALELIRPMLLPGNFYKVNKAAHRLLGDMYEHGSGVEKDLALAYVEYLYAEDYDSIVRMISFGYGIGAADEFLMPTPDEWDEYHALLLLDRAGESDYAYKRMRERASNWFYRDEEKNSTRADYLHEHKYTALARRTACTWAMERCDREFGASESFLLFAGAYFSYLSQGHEGACSYVKDNGGGSTAHLKNKGAAERWLDKAIEEGDEFAISIKAFIERSKEETHE